MANASDYLEWQITSHIFGSGTFTKPTVLAVALCATVPTDAQTGSTIPELANSNGYARVTLNPSETNWTDPVGVGGVCYNLARIDFAAATGNWGWVSGVAICSSATHGAGNVYVHGQLTTPKNIENTDAFYIPVSGVAITLA